MGTNPGARTSRRRRPRSAILLIDTNVVIRFLVGTPAEQAQRARSLFEDGTPVTLVDAIVAEVVYVLESFHELSRTEIANALRGLVARPHVHCERKSTLLFATDVFELTNLDWADCYLIAYASTSRLARVLSFDRGIDKIKDVRVEP